MLSSCNTAFSHHSALKVSLHKALIFLNDCWSLGMLINCWNASWEIFTVLYFFTNQWSYDVWVDSSRVKCLSFFCSLVTFIWSCIGTFRAGVSFNILHKQKMLFICSVFKPNYWIMLKRPVLIYKKCPEFKHAIRFCAFVLNIFNLFIPWHYCSAFVVPNAAFWCL